MDMAEPKKSFLYDILLPKVELIYSVLSILGGLLLWYHKRGGNMLCIVGLMGLAIVYYLKAFEPPKTVDEINFPQQYFDSMGNTFPVNKNQSFFLDSLAPKVMYISSACVLVGIMFKLMFWNGSETMLLAGVPLLTFFVLAWALNQRVNRRAVIIAVLGGIMLFVSSETLMRQLYRDDPQLVETIVYQIHYPHDRAALEAYAKRMRQYRHNH